MPKENWFLRNQQLPRNRQLPRNPPTITWSKPADITYGTVLSSAQLNAVSSVPGTFKYTPDSGALLTVGLQTLSVVFTPIDTTTQYHSLSQSMSSQTIKIQILANQKINIRQLPRKRLPQLPGITLQA